jgi:hypothetical protein
VTRARLPAPFRERYLYRDARDLGRAEATGRARRARSAARYALGRSRPSTRARGLLRPAVSWTRTDRARNKPADIAGRGRSVCLMTAWSRRVLARLPSADGNLRAAGIRSRGGERTGGSATTRGHTRSHLVSGSERRARHTLASPVHFASESRRVRVRSTARGGVFLTRGEIPGSARRGTIHERGDGVRRPRGGR